jgi:CRISPR-associated endonuclease Csn1
LRTRYPDTTIEAVKAELTHDLRIEYDFPKSRLVNDYHHAHDAYLACCISRYVSIRYPSWEKELDYSAFKKFSESEKGHRKACKGFIVGTFSMNGFDKETGEVFRDTWDADKEILRMHRCLAYKDCFISRKTEELTGEFWNATVYSRHIETDKAIPLKQNLDPKKYGYYQSSNSAYYCLFTYTELAQGKTKSAAKLIGVPVNVARKISKTEDLQAWLETRYEDVSIIKPKIMKYQKISWEGCEYYLTSNVEMINARQMWLPESYVADLVECEHAIKKGQADLTDYDEVFIKVYESIIDTIERVYPRYSDLLQKLKSANESFCLADVSDRLTRINEILALLHADATRGLAKNGFAASVGRMTGINYGKLMQKGEIEFIDTSVTGMYERRYSLGV